MTGVVAVAAETSAEQDPPIARVAKLFDRAGNEDAVIELDEITLRYWNGGDAWGVWTKDDGFVDLVVPANWRCARELLVYLRKIEAEIKRDSGPQAINDIWRWSE